MTRVGIPRALNYYQYLPMWRTFFERLGAEVVLSDPTTKAMLANGSSRVVAETCLPTKVYCGHVIDLVGKCDYLFIPSIRSLEENVYNCSKFLGLPDLVRAVVPNCPPILDIDIDINKGKRTLYGSIYDAGRRFAWNPLKVKKAAEAAWQIHQEYLDSLRSKQLTPPDILGETSKPLGKMMGAGRYDLTIAVIGHPYNIYDEHINHRFVKRLRAMGVRVVTAEMAREDELNAGTERIVGRPYWTYEDEVVGAAGHYLHAQVDGVVAMVCFGCGPDSVMIDAIQRYAKQNARTPFMLITLDEHTAEAGLITRLEAFLDMLGRKKRAS
ncbi:MAG: hypothetical protein EPO21_07925 [Chloroflexota bacterium]|nr:MAG: hypothetical protein EPO21_07925 [Chloroflexota bacterium]